MSSRSVVAVYRDVSQVDEPVFAALAAQGSMDVEVIYWNNYGLERSQPDPELGVVPVFPNSPLAGSRVKRRWLDSRSTDSTTLCRSIIDRQPGLVILNDLGSSAKFGLATGLRSHGVTVGFRSDKNLLSEGARRGPPRFIEQMAYRAAFNLLFPISELTRSYYGWPQGHASLFPYCTDTAKFAPADRGARRQAKREALGIKDGVHVLLAVTKFAQREDPLEVLRVFQEVRRRRDDVILVMVGSGPLFRAVQATASDAGLKTAVHLAGYVPYAELQDYFFCADLFLHFPQREPWGVSLGDALCAGLGVIASDRVGAAVELLRGPLRRYVVPAGETMAAAEAVEDLLDRDIISLTFGPAMTLVRDSYSVAATAHRLAAIEI